MAALRTLRPLGRWNLRPVLLLLVLFFVVLPLSVYHFFAFDFQRVASLERRVRGAFPSSAASSALPTCLRVSSQDLLASDAVDRLARLCGVGSSRKTSKLPSTSLRLVHFVHVTQDAVPLLANERETDREQFTYLQFAALQSVRRALQPDMMMLHYLETPRGVWYTQCQRHLGLHQVLPPVAFNETKLGRQQRRRVMETMVMLRALKKHGGVAFADFNTFLMRGTGVDVNAQLVVAGQTRGKRFGLGMHMMQAPPGHPFVVFLEQKIVQMVEENDPKLQQMPLDQVLGQIVLDKYVEEKGSGTNATESIMEGVAIANSKLLEFDGLHELLTAKMGPALAGKFRGVAAFHIDRYDFAEQTADTDDLREIARMQKELTLADEWQKLDTLLGAVVRLAVAANTSAELDPLFT